MDALIELAALRGAVDQAKLTEETRKTVVWSLKQLPSQYEAFLNTYESRYGDAASRLIQGALGSLGKDAASPDASLVATAFLEHLQPLHVRLGLPGPEAARKAG